MISLIQVTVGILFLLGNGYCASPEDAADLRQKTLQITYDMYEMLQLLPPLVDPMDGGVIASPIMALAPLAKLKVFASGLTKSQLTNYLKLSNAQLKEISVPHLQELASKSKNVSFMGYSKTYVQHGLNLSSDFIQKTQEDFGGEVDYINFRFPEEAAKTINEWAFLKSHGVLENVASPSWIDKYSELLFVNVLYLKGSWKTEFIQDNSYKLFIGDNPFNIRDLQYMSRLDDMNYAYSAKLNADIVRLPFSDEDFEFILINPAEFQMEYVLNVTKALQEEPELLENALKLSSPQLVELALPMVKISSVIDLKEVLKALGVSNIFDPRLANLNQMFQGGYKGHVSKMVQRVEVQLDSVGVTASTVVIPSSDVQFQAGPDVKAMKVYATRPFLFQIRFKGLPLFLGSYEGETRI